VSDLVWVKLSPAQVAHREPLRKKGDPVGLMDVFDLALTEMITFYGRGVFSRPGIREDGNGGWDEAPDGPYAYVGLLEPKVSMKDAIDEVYEAYGK